jgi:hypothetical protein
MGRPGQQAKDQQHKSHGDSSGANVPRAAISAIAAAMGLRPSAPANSARY